jgi:hypothetical protein
VISTSYHPDLFTVYVLSNKRQLTAVEAIKFAVKDHKINAMGKRVANNDGSFWWTLAVVSAGVACASHSKLGVTLFGERPSENKSFRSLHEFYPYYLTEHRNPISRGLHVLGTTIFFLVLLARYRLQIPNLVIAFALGTILSEFLSPLPNGFVEFFAMGATVSLLAWARKMSVPWILPLIGYFFAWIGHFCFEKNRPATFIYPSYSLLSDFIMWFQTLSGRLPLTQELNETASTLF